jgi:DNA polymerase-3 subunit beta
MTYHNAAAILADPATAVVERAPLTKAFEIVNNAVESRNTIPVLANAKLQGDGDVIFVTGTDLDLELTVAIPAAADSRFALTLPAAKMRDLLKKATASDFVAFTAPEVITKKRMKTGDWNAEKHAYDMIETGETYQECDGAATIDFERVKYRLAAIPASDFPTLRGPSPLAHDLVTVDSSYRSFNLDGSELWNAIDGTMSGMSSEETRYYLNGIYLHCHYDGALRFVATDGHRLYRQDVGAPGGADGMSGIIIPRKAVALLHKLLKGKACPEKVAIDLTNTKVRFTWGDSGFYVTLTSKLIDGTFPDYQRVIPTGNDKFATFDPDTMLEAVRAVTLISSERGRAVKMDFHAGNCGLAVNNPDMGAAAAEIACEFDADPVEIGFNYGYLADAIATAALDGGNVKMALADAGSPTLITGSREGWLGVIMPMRV